MTWQAGDHLVVRGAGWRVVRVSTFSDCEALDLAGDGSAATRTLLLPFDRPRRLDPGRLRVVTRRQWAWSVGALLRRSHPYGGLRRCPGRIRLLPYQLEPALAMFRHGELRILIADDVGLGKTVEAGLIAGEMVARRPRARILITCPSSIRDQWAEELSTLFGLEVTNADSSWLRRTSRELPRDVNPWSLPGLYLASIDFVKRAEALHGLEQVRWDLLVADEAHGATPGSDRHAALHALGVRSARVVLLTATPHSGEPAQFDALCRLGAGREEPPILLFRRSRADTPLARHTPRSVVLPVRLAEEERRTHRLLADYTVRLWRESQARGETRGRLLAMVLRKRALSSAASLLLSLNRRLQLLPKTSSMPAQRALPLHEDDANDDDAAGDELLEASGLNDAADEQDVLATLSRAAEAAHGRDSKLRVLLRFLRRTAEPAIVFTEYRDTAEHIARALSGAGGDVTVLHGGLTRPERKAVLERFISSGCRLVATDAASEGLNLHHVCLLVVHFELPWSPLRMQQRCGRVHRIGQARRVHEIALVAADTCEQLVVQPLIRRALDASAFAEDSIAGRLRESRTAELIFDEPAPRKHAVRPDVASTTLMDLRSEAADEAARLGLLRRIEIADASRLPTRGGVPIATRRPPPLTPTMDVTLLLTIILRTPAGETLERLPLGVALRTGVDWERSWTALREQVRGMLDAVRDTVASIAGSLGRTRADAFAPVRTAAARRARRRSIARARQTRSAARQMVQAGLFDRRALRAARARDPTDDALLDDTGRRGEDPQDESACSIDYEVSAVLVSPEGR